MDGNTSEQTTINFVCLSLLVPFFGYIVMPLCGVLNGCA